MMDLIDFAERTILSDWLIRVVRFSRFLLKAPLGDDR
jgi:hypothetical protein